MNLIRGTRLQRLEDADCPRSNLIALSNESGPIFLADRGPAQILNGAALPLGLGQRALLKFLRHPLTPFAKVLKQKAVVGHPPAEHLQAGQRAQRAAQNQAVKAGQAKLDLLRVFVCQSVHGRLRGYKPFAALHYPRSPVPGKLPSA